MSPGLLPIRLRASFSKTVKRRLIPITLWLVAATRAFFGADWSVQGADERPSPASEAQPARKPNILVIWGDDVGIHNISAYNLGLMGYKTPNIDRIAKEGALSPTPMRSRAAQPAALPSSSASTPSAPGC